jgi:hypothetical protein
MFTCFMVLLSLGLIDSPKGGSAETKQAKAFNLAVETIATSYAELSADQIDLGDLPPGAQVTIRALIRNTRYDDIDVDEAVGDSARMKVQLSAKTIPEGGSAELVIGFTTEERADRVMQNFSINLVEKGKANIFPVRFKYNLAGLLRFPTRFALGTFTPHDVESVIRIPFLYSSPIERKNILVTFDGAAKESTYEFVEEGDRSFLVCRVAIDKDERGVLGGVTIQDKVSGVQDRIGISIEAEKVLTASPGNLRLTKHPVEKTKWQAVSIVRVRDPQVRTTIDASSVDKDKNYVVTCELLDTTIQPEVRIKTIGPGIYRATIIVDESQRLGLLDKASDKFSASVEWRVVGDFGESRTRSSLMVQ